MAIRVLGSDPTVSTPQTNTGAPITAVPVPGWSVPTGLGVYMGTSVEDGYSDTYSDTYRASQLLCGSMTLRNAAGQPTGNVMALHVTTPGAPSYDQVIVPTTTAQTSTVGDDGFSGGADISDLVQIDLGDGIARVAGVCFSDYHGWEIATDGRYPSYLVFERDPVTLDWSYDATRSKTADQLYSSAPAGFRAALFESRTNSFAESYRFNPGLNEIAVCPISGHLLVTCYFPSTTTNSGSVIAIDPATSAVVAYLRIPDFTHPDTGHDVQWAPREIQTDPSSSGATRAVVLGDCVDLDDSTALPHTMLEVEYDPVGATITQTSAPCLPPLDDTDYACAGFSSDGVLYAATHYVASTLAGLASRPLNVFRTTATLPGTGEDYGTRATPSYTVASMAGAGATPFVLEQDPDTGTVVTVGAFGGRIRSWQPASPDADTTSLALNPTFSANITDWSGRLLTCSASWDAGDSGRLKATGNGSASTMSVRQTTQTLPAQAEGRSMVCSARVRAGQAGSMARVGIDFLTAAGTIRSAQFGSWRTTTTGATTEVYGDAVVPAGVTSYRVFVEWDTNVNGDIHYVLTNDLRFAPGTDYGEVDITTSLFVSGQSNVRRGGIVGDTLAVVVQPYSTTHDYPAAPYDLDSYIVTIPLAYLVGGAPLGRNGVKVEIGFGATWQTEPADIVWTDVTDWVFRTPGIKVRRGASAARGQVDVGTGGLSLKNIDRRFDPLYTAGPYYGDLKPGVPVRVSMVPDGEAGAFVLRGTVPSWPQRYDVSNRLSVVPIEIFDGFDKVARAVIPRSVLEKEILADDPVAYWPLNETTGSTMADLSGNLTPGTYQEGTPALHQTVEFQDGGQVNGINFDGNHWGHVKDGDQIITARPAVIELVAAPAENASSEIPLRTADGNGTGTAGITFQIAGMFDAEYAWAMSARVGGNDFISSGILAADDLHHVAYRVPAAGDAEVYIDGTEDTTDSATTTPTTSTPVTTGTTIGARKPNGQGGYLGFLGHVAIFDTDIGAVRIAAHAAAALAPLDGQTTGARAGWILDEVGWPTNARDLDTGETTLGPATFKPGDKALDYLRLVDASEDVRSFITASGDWRFPSRYWRWTATEATVSQFTFTDNGDPTESGYADFQIDLDDELLVNAARFSRRGGTEQVALDQTSIDTYGYAERQQTDLLQRTDNEVLSLAEWSVATQATPQPRCPTIRVPLHHYTPEKQQEVLGLEMGYRVSVERTPQGVGDPIELDLIIDGIEHAWSETAWWLTLFVSPAPDATLTPFRWDVSEWDGTDQWAY